MNAADLKLVASILQLLEIMKKAAQVNPWSPTAFSSA
jgi:hypothetical protein